MWIPNNHTLEAIIEAQETYARELFVNTIQTLSATDLLRLNTQRLNQHREHAYAATIRTNFARYKKNIIRWERDDYPAFCGIVPTSPQIRNHKHITQLRRHYTKLQDGKTTTPITDAHLDRAFLRLSKAQRADWKAYNPEEKTK